jgi:hypothetical protein
MAEVAVPRDLFADILRLTVELRAPPDIAPAWLAYPRAGAKAKEEVRPDEGKIDIPGLKHAAVAGYGAWQP